NPAGGGYYFLLADGTLHAWAGSIAASPVVARLDPAYWQDPQRLIHATPPGALAAASVTINGTQLTVTAPPGFVGTFRVRVTASDGILTDTKSFLVTITDAHTPVLQRPPDVTVPHTQSVPPVTLSATDADGDPITFSAQVQGYSLLYDLEKQLALTGGGN